MNHKTGKRKEPDMAKRENEGKKEKKQKKERKEKRKQYRGLYLNPISVPRASTRACERRRIACTCTFRETGEAAKEIVANCINLDSRPVLIRWLSRLKAYRHDAFCRRARIRRTLMRERPLRCRTKVRCGSP